MGIVISSYLLGSHINKSIQFLHVWVQLVINLGKGMSGDGYLKYCKFFRNMLIYFVCFFQLLRYVRDLSLALLMGFLGTLLIDGPFGVFTKIILGMYGMDDTAVVIPRLHLPSRVALQYPRSSTRCSLAEDIFSPLYSVGVIRV